MTRMIPGLLWRTGPLLTADKGALKVRNPAASFFWLVWPQIEGLSVRGILICYRSWLPDVLFSAKRLLLIIPCQLNENELNDLMPPPEVMCLLCVFSFPIVLFFFVDSDSAGHNMNNAILQLHIKYEQTRNEIELIRPAVASPELNSTTRNVRSFKVSEPFHHSNRTQSGKSGFCAHIWNLQKNCPETPSLAGGLRAVQFKSALRLT